MKYYFILASEDFFLTDEPFEEVLRERSHYNSNENKPNDFWIISNPEFVKNYSKEITKFVDNNSRNLMSIVSTNLDFIYWLKLRYQNVVIGEFNGPTNSILSPLR